MGSRDSVGPEAERVPRGTSVRDGGSRIERCGTSPERERSPMDVRLTDVLVADAKLLADGLLQPEDDMAVFVGRGGKGRVAPFTVRRSYTGAGGWYVESMALLAPNGDVAWRGDEQPITLRGSSKIDLFSDDVHGVVVDSADDHELVFLVGGDEVGRVPIAILDEDPPYATRRRTGRGARRSCRGWCAPRGGR